MVEKIEKPAKNMSELLADIKYTIVSSQRTGKSVKMIIDVKDSSVHVTEIRETFTKYKTNS